jgi:hypothetical protein
MIFDLEFKEHLLKRRLKRAPKERLTNFWKKDINFSQEKSLNSIIDRIIFECQIRKKDDCFKNKFLDFLRDVVLTAREADYLISLQEPTSIIDWIKSWKGKLFPCQKHDVQLHTIVKLNEKLSQEGIYYPTFAIFLVASNQTKTEELDGLEVVSYHPTTEFEIIIRDNFDILEIRGPYAVVKDFVSTAILDKNNPLSAAHSYFIGEKEDVSKGQIAPIRQIIKIEALKNILCGSYTQLKASFPGTKTSMVEVTLENLSNVNEEDHPEAKAVLLEMLKNPVKGNLSFSYQEKQYSFVITKTGGLFFRKYIPEEVVTYILYKIKLSCYGKNGS